MSQITVNVVDTFSGKPIPRLRVFIYKGENDEWTEISWGVTDPSGKITDLLPSDLTLQKGIYKLRFDTKDYFDNLKVPTFYPYVEIVIDIVSDEHYHVPLLMGPFGYSTYRGV